MSAIHPRATVLSQPPSASDTHTPRGKQTPMNRQRIHQLAGRFSALALLLLIIGFSASNVNAQGVAGGTVISNRVTFVYTEPTGSTVPGVSNTVTVTVTNVTGLAITPDGAVSPGVNGGATNVQRTFVLSNTGNISETISFGASGASLIRSGPFTVTSAFVDVDNSGGFNTGDINILAASPGNLTMAFQTSVNVLVIGDVSATAAEGSTITLQLGDTIAGGPSFDNVPADLTAGSVKTVGSTGVNGQLEARGNLSFNVLATGSVLLGPQGQPAAVGPTNNNDDYTNKTMSGAAVAVPQGGTTTAGGVITFVNTIRNGSATVDNMVITAPTVPAGFTVEVRSGANPFANITAAGSSATISVPGSSDLNIDVRVTAPTNISVLTGFSTVIRATSGITPSAFNETIDRLWTGFVSAVKSVTVTNSTGIGPATAAVPGAVIEYTIVYTNVTTTGGTNNVPLIATNFVLTEDGSAAPNNWASTTTHVAGSASDTLGGVITGDTAGSGLLTDTIPTLAPGASGTFKFRRTIK